MKKITISLIAALALSFTACNDKAETLEERIENRADILDERSDDLAEAAEEIESATENLEDAIEDFQDALEEVDNKADRELLRVRINKMIDDINLRAENQL